jgi:hypothetical protein
MNQFWSKVDFPPGGLAFGFHEFAMVEGPPKVKLGIKPVNPSTLHPQIESKAQG